MKLDASKYLYDYWDGLRGDRMAPARKELDPSILKDVLPNLFLLDRHGPANYDFRLAGTKTCDIFGKELRGDNFLDLWNDNDRDSFISLFDTLAEQGASIVCGLKGESQGRLVEFEFIALPLFHGNKPYCSSIIGSFTSKDLPNNDYLLPIEKIEMSSLRVIWPAEKAVIKPEAVSKDNGALKLSPVIATEDEALKRRAAFTVIEGGRK